MRINVGKTDKKATSEERHDLIEALREIDRREKAHLKIAIPYEAAEKLSQFLKEKGLRETQSIPMLIEYGLSEESEEELQKLESERESQVGRMWHSFAVMKFKTYEYFMDNKSFVMRLSLMLSENRTLKKRLEALGMQALVPKDEWDNWNQETLERYFRKYIFTNRS